MIDRDIDKYLCIYGPIPDIKMYILLAQSLGWKHHSYKGELDTFQHLENIYLYFLIKDPHVGTSGYLEEGEFSIFSSVDDLTFVQDISERKDYIFQRLKDGIKLVKQN